MGHGESVTVGVGETTTGHPNHHWSLAHTTPCTMCAVHKPYILCEPMTRAQAARWVHCTHRRDAINAEQGMRLTSRPSTDATMSPTCRTWLGKGESAPQEPK
jgi:hypothetical protein